MRNMHHTSKSTVQNRLKPIQLMRGQQEVDLFHWNWWLNIFIKDLFVTNTQLFTSQAFNGLTEVMWITVMFFISRLDSHSEDPLVSKWCNVKFLKICTDGKQTHLHLEYIYIEWVYFQQILILWMNYSFNNTAPWTINSLISHLPKCN